jgi:translocator protein
MDVRSKYLEYNKPPLSPPSFIFGWVWPILYAIIALTYMFVFCQISKGNLSFNIAIPFIINLVTNILFVYLQFGIQKKWLAMTDILFVLATIIVTMIVIWPHFHWVAYLQIPYLVWVLFATYLQIGVTILNKR